MIYVIATIEIDEARRDEYLAEVRQIVPLVRDEDGCIEYGPTSDLETNISAQQAIRSGIVTMVEKWESVEALEAHLIAPHMVEYRTKVKDIVKNVTLQILEPV